MVSTSPMSMPLPAMRSRSGRAPRASASRNQLRRAVERQRRGRARRMHARHHRQRRPGDNVGNQARRPGERASVVQGELTMWRRIRSRLQARPTRASTENGAAVLGEGVLDHPCGDRERPVFVGESFLLPPALRALGVNGVIHKRAKIRARLLSVKPIRSSRRRQNGRAERRQPSRRERGRTGRHMQIATQKT